MTWSWPELAAAVLFGVGIAWAGAPAWAVLGFVFLYLVTRT